MGMYRALQGFESMFCILLESGTKRREDVFCICFVCLLKTVYIFLVLQLNRRKILFVLYLMRDPFFKKYTR